MQFEKPDLLWGLLALVIPVIIHLFRLRRFQKTPFTNVRVLQKLLAESRKSSELKKWLLLLSRLGLVAALVFAFANPFEVSETAKKEREIVLYLDNSFSMQAPQEDATLLENAVQSLLQNSPENKQFHILTNNGSFPGVRPKEIQQSLLNLKYTTDSPYFEELYLKARALFSENNKARKELWLISDFQKLRLPEASDTDSLLIRTVVARPEKRFNISLDTAFILNRNAEGLELEVGIRLDDSLQKKPVSLFNGDTLIAKASPEMRSDGRAAVIFSLPADKNINGTLSVMDDGLKYDNMLYFNLFKDPLIRVLSLGPGPTDYLERIYTADEFEFLSMSERQLDYNLMEQQQLIILNELRDISPSLGKLIRDYRDTGGSLLIIPAREMNVSSLNRLLSGLGSTRYGERIDTEIRITKVNTTHPIFREVFEKQVANFDFPVLQSYFPLINGPAKILELQNGEAFLSGRNGTYVFAAPINPNESNFSASPLIVPTFYRIAKESLSPAPLYFEIGRQNSLDLEAKARQDGVMELQSESYAFIPRQQQFIRKTRLFFSEEPETDGIYSIRYSGNALRNISFNFPRTESVTVYPELNFPENVYVSPSIEALLQQYQNETNIRSLWKWFVILALLFVLAEMILQKTLQ